jgi:hypothetical protein
MRIKVINEKLFHQFVYGSSGSGSSKDENILIRRRVERLLQDVPGLLPQLNQQNFSPVAKIVIFLISIQVEGT